VPLLVAEALRVADEALGPLTLSLRAGEQIGLLTPDHGEARPLLRTLARLQRPNGGLLFWFGVNVTQKPRWLLPQRLKARVLLLWANPYGLFEGNTRVRTLLGRSNGLLSAPDRLHQDSGLSPALLATRVKALSGVTRVRVALAYAQQRQPTVLLVGDIFSHLVPESWPGILDSLMKVVGRNGGVVIASRYLEALRSASQVIDLSGRPGGLGHNIDN